MAYFATGTSRLLSPTGFETDTEASRTADLLRQVFPERRGPAFYVVLHSQRSTAADPAYRAQIQAWQRDLQRLTLGSRAVVDPPVISADRHTVGVVVESNQTPDQFVDLARRAERIHHPGPAQSSVGGLGAVYANFVADSEQDFGQSERVSAPIAVVLLLLVFSGVDSPARRAAMARAVRKATGGQPVRGPAEVPAQLAPLYLRGRYAVFEIQQPAADNDDRTHQWLDHLRSTSWPAGVKVELGGEAPAYQDFLRVLAGDFPVIFGTVLALTFLLLGLAFRSLALPIKAVLMNLLSIGAAMGVLTWVFQEGHFAGQLNFQAAGFVDATVPVIIFAGLFGLSMDYEVFLLSRVREEWLRGRSNAVAVATGMERTGQIITSAALILVVVVSTLAFSHLSLNKGFGVTFAVAVLLDATVIRLTLVPAMMRVLGNLNWWPQRRVL